MRPESFECDLTVANLGALVVDGDADNVAELARTRSRSAGGIVGESSRRKTASTLVFDRLAC